MTRVLRGLLAVATVAFGVLAVGSASAAFPGENGLIAFSSSRDGNFEIYVMNPDGSEERRLTKQPAADLYPAWSPDGAEIAFVSMRDGDEEIFLMDASGGNVRQLTRNRPPLLVPKPDKLSPGRTLASTPRLADIDPSWSPDGEQIAFSSNRDGDFEIFVMDRDGRNVKQLTHNDAMDKEPVWSPDGSTIAFTSGRDSTTRVYFMNADGLDERPLASLARSSAPSWAPDGRIAVVDGGTIYLAESDGGNPSKLTDNGVYTLSWSPDGSQIIYMSSSGGAHLVAIDVETQVKTPLTLSDSQVADPDWQPVLQEPASPVEEAAPAPPASTEKPDPKPVVNAPGCTITGTPGDDVLVGTPGRDVICGLGGNDLIKGRGGNDLIKAGPGDDIVKAGTGHDRIFGGAGDDELYGQGGRDTIKAGRGDDELAGNNGPDRLYGQAGDDTFHAKQGGRDLLKGGKGVDDAKADQRDRLRSIEHRL